MDNRELIPSLNQLRYFYFVGKTRSYTKAAEELFLSEPAVHMQLRSLERSLGTKLLDRQGKELKLTESGIILYDYAERVFSLVQEAVNRITLLKNLDEGSLRLGSTRALVQHLLPSIISSFLKRHPGIRIVLTEDKTTDVVDAVVHGKNDIAIVGRIPYPPQIDATSFFRVEMLVVVSPSGRLSQKKFISIRELANEPLICSTMRAATRLKIEEIFEERSLKPRVAIEVENVDFIKKLVREEKGYSVLSELWLKEEIQKGELIPLRFKEGRIFLEIDAICRKDEPLSMADAAFLGFLKEGIKSQSQVKRHG